MDSELSSGPMAPKEIERARQVNEMIGVLRNFAEHFGAVEVYRQAKTICMESDEGCAAIKDDWLEFQEDVVSLTNRAEDRSEARFQKVAATSGKANHRSSAFADAKRALGG